jgi:hypothetical protein
MWSTGYACQILMELEFSPTYFRTLLKYQISWISVQREPSCSAPTDGRTDMTKQIGAFRNFANAPKNVLHLARFKLQNMKQFKYEHVNTHKQTSNTARYRVHTTSIGRVLIRMKLVPYGCICDDKYWYRALLLYGRTVLVQWRCLLRTHTGTPTLHRFIYSKHKIFWEFGR